jgi:hypothetical protein
VVYPRWSANLTHDRFIIESLATEGVQRAVRSSVVGHGGERKQVSDLSRSTLPSIHPNKRIMHINLERTELSTIHHTSTLGNDHVKGIAGRNNRWIAEARNSQWKTTNDGKLNTLFPDVGLICVRAWGRIERQSTKSRSMSCRKKSSQVRKGEGGLSLRHTTGDMLPNRMSWKFSISHWDPSSVSVSSESVILLSTLRRARRSLLTESCIFLVKLWTAWLSEQENQPSTT